MRLQGRFTYDGVSPDGRRLYLLERLDADRYQVRMYDLPRGALAPYVISEKSEIGQPMSGTALGGFTTRDGAMQLTLYQRDAEGQAFVHALPVGQEQEWAFCVDLPGPAGGPPELRQRQIDTVEDASDGPAVAVSPDGRIVYAGTSRGVLALDAGTLKPRGMGLIGRPDHRPRPRRRTAAGCTRWPAPRGCCGSTRGRWRSPARPRSTGRWERSCTRPDDWPARLAVWSSSSND